MKLHQVFFPTMFTIFVLSLLANYTTVIHVAVATFSYITNAYFYITFGIVRVLPGIHVTVTIYDYITYVYNYITYGILRCLSTSNVMVPVQAFITHVASFLTQQPQTPGSIYYNEVKTLMFRIFYRLMISMQG